MQAGLEIPVVLTPFPEAAITEMFLAMAASMAAFVVS